MKFRIVGAITIFVFGTGYQEHISYKETAARKTLDAQVVPEKSRPAKMGADNARATLAQSDSDIARATELSLAVDEAEAEIALAAAKTDGNDIRFARSMSMFEKATQMIMDGNGNLSAQQAETALVFLRQSRDLALESRGQVPTANSPTNTLKALRKHQRDDRHYDYNKK